MAPFATVTPLEEQEAIQRVALEWMMYQQNEQTVLVVGASGATGRLLVEQLLTRGSEVRVVVRSEDGLPEALRRHHRLSMIQASLLDLDDTELKQLTDGCDAAASCLGHNMSLTRCLRSAVSPCHRSYSSADRGVKSYCTR